MFVTKHEIKATAACKFDSLSFQYPILIIYKVPNLEETEGIGDCKGDCPEATR